MALIRPPTGVSICFINLASDVDRRCRLEAELQRLGLQGQRLDAVRWKNLSTAQQAEFYSDTLNARQYHVALVDGEKGCYASHIVAWENLLRSNAAAMLVLEDDVRLSDGLPEVLRAIQELELPWDMVKMIGREKEKIRSQWPLTDGVRLVEYQRIPSMTAGYVVSRRGAEKLIASRKPFGRPIDVDLRFWWENNLVVLGVTPSVLILDETSFISSIGQKGVKKNWYGSWRKFKVKLELTVRNALGNLKRGKLLH
jgi:glycosyl transferase family 25